MDTSKIAVLGAGALLVTGLAATAPEQNITDVSAPEKLVTEPTAEGPVENPLLAADKKRKALRAHHTRALSDRAKRLRENRVELAQKLRAERARLSHRATRTVTVRSAAPKSRSMGTYSSNQALGKRMAAARGWTGEQWPCLRELWTRESGWRTAADNSNSSAYGIPQALPGRKMASAGSDWLTNPATQIEWGLGYIAGRYGTPCGAWSAFQSKGWY